MKYFQHEKKIVNQEKIQSMEKMPFCRVQQDLMKMMKIKKKKKNKKKVKMKKVMKMMKVKKV